MILTLFNSIPVQLWSPAYWGSWLSLDEEGGDPSWSWPQAPCRHEAAHCYCALGRCTMWPTCLGHTCRICYSLRAIKNGTAWHAKGKKWTGQPCQYDMMNLNLVMLSWGTDRKQCETISLHCKGSEPIQVLHALPRPGFVTTRLGQTVQGRVQLLFAQLKLYCITNVCLKGASPSPKPNWPQAPCKQIP